MRAGAGPAELAAYLDAELPAHFGLAPRSHDTGRFAQRLHAAWVQRTAR